MPDFDVIFAGFQAALTWDHLLAALIGALLGTVVGVLPGLGPSTSIALLIPVAFVVPADLTLIVMTSLYCGAMYGGTLTAVLLKMPGDVASAMTVLDGYEMARQGRAGPALAISAIGSFISGSLSLLALTFLTPIFAQFALSLSPAGFFSLLVFALLLSASLLGSDVLKGLASVVLGLLAAIIGTDISSGVPRLAFGQNILLDGIDQVVVLIGLFGVGEVFWFLAHRSKETGERIAFRGRPWLHKGDWGKSWQAILRGWFLGFFSGLHPGGGPTVGTMLSYTVEKRVARDPDSFGKGNIAGVAGPEAANNAASNAAMIPMLALGIPASGSTAVLLAVFTMYGLQPGPLLMTNHPDLVWLVIASLYLSNIMLLFINLPFIGVFTRILDIPVHYLMPVVLVIATIGAYSERGSIGDVLMLFIFGLLGFVLRAVGIPLVPMVLAFILEGSIESAMRQALTLGGTWSTFVTQPVSLVFLLLGVAVIVYEVVHRLRHREETATPELTASSANAESVESENVNLDNTVEQDWEEKNV